MEERDCSRLDSFATARATKGASPKQAGRNAELLLEHAGEVAAMHARTRRLLLHRKRGFFEDRLPDPGQPRGRPVMRKRHLLHQGEQVVERVGRKLRGRLQARPHQRGDRRIWRPTIPATAGESALAIGLALVDQKREDESTVRSPLIEMRRAGRLDADIADFRTALAPGKLFEDISAQKEGDLPEIMRVQRLRTAGGIISQARADAALAWRFEPAGSCQGHMCLIARTWCDATKLVCRAGPVKRADTIEPDRAPMMRVRSGSGWCCGAVSGRSARLAVRSPVTGA
jgi:hypothetical protein